MRRIARERADGMKHKVTRALYDYWTELRGDRVAPERHEIDPGEIRLILGDTFILEVLDRDTLQFRLAGTRVCAALGRELKGNNILQFWSGRDREAVTSMLAAVVEDGAAAVIGVAATNDRDQSTPAELVFLPLRQSGAGHTRILGCYALHEPPYWLGLIPVVRQPVLSLRLVWPDERPTFLDAPMPFPEARGRVVHLPRSAEARRVAHLVVYDGGKGG